MPTPKRPHPCIPCRTAAATQHLRQRASLVAVALLVATSCGSDAPDPSAVDPTATSSSAPVGATAGVTVSEQAITGEPGQPSTDEIEAEEEGYDRASVDLRAQVPDTALAYFEFESLTILEELSLRIATLTEAPPEQMLGVSLATLPIAGVGIDQAKIDRNAPLALAYVPVPGDLFPAPVVIVPAVDEGPVVTSFQALANRGMRVRRISGGYAVIEPAGLDDSTARGGSALSSDLPEAALRGRFETEMFLTLLNPALEPVSQALRDAYRESRPRGWSGTDHDFSPANLTKHLRGSEQVGFGFDMEGDRATLSLRLVDSADGTYGDGQSAPDMSATLDELSHHLDVEGPIAFVTAFDPETAVETLRDLWERREEWMNIGGVDLFGSNQDDARNNRSELSASALDSMEAAMIRMLGSFQPGAGFAFQMEPSKAHLAIYLAARNPDRARESISLLLSKCDLETWGFEMALPIRSMMDGTLVEDYNVRFDTRRLDFDSRAAMRNGFKTYLGDSSLHLKVASVGRHVLVILGGDTPAVDARIREFSDKGLGNVEYVRAADQVAGADSATIGHVDLVQVLGQLSGLGAVSRGISGADTHREMKRDADDQTAPFFIWNSLEGRDSIYGASFDLFSLKTAFQAFENSGL